MAGTAELLALELGRALEPLAARLALGDLAGVFAELGLPLPDAALNAPPVATATTQATQALKALPDKVAELARAVHAGDDALAGQALAVLGPLEVAAFAAVGGLAAAVADAFPAPPPELAQIVGQLSDRLLHATLVGYLEASRPGLAASLALLGLIESVSEPAEGARPPYRRRTPRLDRLGAVLSDPARAVRERVGWGEPAGDLGEFLPRLAALLEAAGLPAVAEGAGAEGPRLSTFLFSAEPGSGAPVPLKVTLAVSDFSKVNESAGSPGGRWTVRIHGAERLNLGREVRVEPPGRVVPLAPGPGTGGELAVEATRSGPVVLFGLAGGSRLSAGGVVARVGLDFEPAGGGVAGELTVDVRLVDGRLVLALSDLDGFLAAFLPPVADVGFNGGLRWSGPAGLVPLSGTGLRVTVPLTAEFGALRLDRLDLTLLPGGQGLAAEARLAGSIALGPFTVALEGVGAGCEVALRQSELGPLDLDFGFLAPRGLGLEIEAGPVRGGGFLAYDAPAARYGGAFQVDVGPVGVGAFVLLNTRMPGGGYALLVVLRGSFPPIQLGFGFALSSVGGLLALNRRIDVDALRARFAGGVVGRILAPQDPVGDAPALLADLDAVFPPAPGVVVAGPTLQLSWAELVRFDIGVFVELPGPSKVVLLGSARAAIPGPAGPLMQIRLDIIGLLDLARQVLEFDAALVDSHLLEVLELSGGAAFRMSWGAQPYVLLAVGGFHPAYSPAPLVLPSSLTRAAMTCGAPKDLFYLRFEGYFAITTNSFQLGAAVEAAINAGPFNARGLLGFDALIRLDPFFFQFSFEASIRVRFDDVTLYGVSLRGQLSGPGPITLRGEYCLEILFVEICFSGTFTLGSGSRPAAVPATGVVARLAGELARPGALAAAGGAVDRYVVTEAAPGVFSPLGEIACTQSLAPLGLLLQRFQGHPLDVPQTVTVRPGGMVRGPATDWFAPGGHAELTDSDALNRRAFERLDGGVILGDSGLAYGAARDREVKVRQIRLPKTLSAILHLFTVPGWLDRAAARRTGAIEKAVVSPALSVVDERWEVRGANGGVVLGELSESQAHQLTAAGRGVAALPGVDQVPSLTF
ncbi:DUF6603 domain-containing protein [Nonomuraea endophytica]|uniref:DUF6603 domain-containing protein n=1 Tax=Nonomuraea endophytica TaxID=714136 RepID=A0A7W8EH93_9ACTN|nr:DUF6603 domain-containing protein [Nonomuraea endophytica]MBB5079313.1 hypothetical protein [Nonomuraea endophytica]